MEEDNKVRLVLIGDGTTGKTALLAIYKDNRFDPEYHATVIDAFALQIKLNGRIVDVEIHDTAGQEDYVSIRQLYYPGTHLFMMCYSCVERKSLESLRDFWNREVENNVPTAKKVIIGNKLDLKTAQIQNYVPEKEARAVMKQIGAKAQLQCSSLLEAVSPGQGHIQKVFKTALKYGFYQAFPDEAPSKWYLCTIL